MQQFAFFLIIDFQYFIESEKHFLSLQDDEKTDVFGFNEEEYSEWAIPSWFGINKTIVH